MYGRCLKWTVSWSELENECVAVALWYPSLGEPQLLADGKTCHWLNTTCYLNAWRESSDPVCNICYTVKCIGSMDLKKDSNVATVLKALWAIGLSKQLPRCRPSSEPDQWRMQMLWLFLGFSEGTELMLMTAFSFTMYKLISDLFKWENRCLWWHFNVNTVGSD